MKVERAVKIMDIVLENGTPILSYGMEIGVLHEDHKIMKRDGIIKLYEKVITKKSKKTWKFIGEYFEVSLNDVLVRRFIMSTD